MLGYSDLRPELAAPTAKSLRETFAQIELLLTTVTFDRCSSDGQFQKTSLTQYNTNMLTRLYVDYSGLWPISSAI